jgi:membrane protein DedA with SNARE-associated domain
MLRRFLSWLNRKLNIVETDPVKNEYYDKADQWLDRHGK